MIERECNLRARVYKVQTFGTTQQLEKTIMFLYQAKNRVVRQIISYSVI